MSDIHTIEMPWDKVSMMLTIFLSNANMPEGKNRSRTWQLSGIRTIAEIDLPDWISVQLLQQVST